MTALARSSQFTLVRSGDPFGEALALATPGRIAAAQPFYVLDQMLRGRLETPQLATEARLLPGRHGEAASQMHLEALDQLAVPAGYQLALEPDVGDLGTSA